MFFDRLESCFSSFGWNRLEVTLGPETGECQASPPGSSLTKGLTPFVVVTVVFK